MNHDTRVRSAFWVGCRIADTVGSYWSKVCRQAGGEPASADGGLLASGGLLGHENEQDL